MIQWRHVVVYNRFESHLCIDADWKFCNMSKKTAYKWCLVDGCSNSTRKTPDKIFSPVPVNPIVWNEWFESAQRRDKPGTSNMFCCQDHFDVHSRFPVTRPPFYERVTVPHNEQTIDPSSPTTTEWSALEFETVINEFDGFYHKLMRK